jgi:hypothetical protein
LTSAFVAGNALYNDAGEVASRYQKGFPGRFQICQLLTERSGNSGGLKNDRRKEV